jgi:hypothetical protein
LAKNNSIPYLKSFASAIKINRKGISIEQKLVIIESDDWGAIRTPSKEYISYFDNKGFEILKVYIKTIL